MARLRARSRVEGTSQRLTRGCSTQCPRGKQCFWDVIDRKLHDEVISLEREFNVALSVNTRRAATDGDDAEVKRLGVLASWRLCVLVQSFERRLSRYAEHVAALETRMKKIEHE